MIYTDEFVLVCENYDENYLLGYADDGGILMKIDKQTGETEYLGARGGLIPIDWWSTNKFCIVGNTIFFSEYIGKRLAGWERVENKLTIYPLNMKFYNSLYPMVSALECYGDKLYIFPSINDEVFIYDINKNELKSIKILGGIEVELEKRLFWASVRIENVEYLFLGNEGKVVRFNLISNNVSIMQLDIELGEIRQVQYQKETDTIYILTRTSDIYQWNKSNDKIKCIVSGKKHEPDRLGGIYRMLVAGSKIYYFSLESESVCFYDMQTKTTYIFSKPDDLKKNKWTTVVYDFFNYCEDQEYYYLVSAIFNYMLKISKYSGDAFWVKLISMGCNERMKFLMDNNEQLVESGLSNLEKYLLAIID